MKFARRFALLVALSALFPLALSAQQQDKDDKSNATTKLRIEVTGGEKDQPVDNASVYVKFTDPHSKKFIEMNLKTNQQGIAHSPEIPAGKVLIQIIAEKWKTFGKWYEVEAGPQTIKIRLEKPHKWY